MAHQLLALYNQPADPAAFDAHYEQTHAGLGLAFPGLVSFATTHPGNDQNGAPGPYYLVAQLTFADEDAMNAALSGPEGAAAVEDLGNFAQAGVTLVSGPVTTYR